MIAQQAGAVPQVRMRLKTANQNFFWVGALLCALFVLQDALAVKWAWFESLQANEVYKRWSGLALMLYIAEQSFLSITRIRGQRRWAKTLYKVHNVLGVFAPVFYYIHSTEFGYGYLFVLSFVYYSNLIVGLLNQKFWHINISHFNQVWMVMHVTFSVLTIILGAYHVFIAFYYQ